MRWHYVLLMTVAVSQAVFAGEWVFGSVAAVSRIHGKKIYHHLDAAGRKSIAVSAGTVGIVWEDNQSGAPQIYLALKSPNTENFGEPQQISTGKEAYEPVIAALGNQRFILLWEQDGNIKLRLAAIDDLGNVITVSKIESRQATLTVSKTGEVYAAWAQRHGKGYSIMAAQIDPAHPEALLSKPVEPDAIDIMQAYPALTSSISNLVVAWEDRRTGVSRILYSQRKGRGKFTRPKLLHTIVKKSEAYGEAQGVARPSLATYSANSIAYCWLDKRAYRTGYEVYARLTSGKFNSPGPETKVQDSFGDNVPQWHASMAGDEAGHVVSAWDDTRQGNSDIWLSWLTPKGWSDDVSIPAAATPKNETSPAIALDESGQLHLTWIAQDEQTVILYTSGKWQE